MPRYSGHAKQQMQARGVTEQDVELALVHPQGAPLPGQPGSVWIRGYVTEGRILKVCVRATDHNYVITAAWPGR